MTSPKPQSGTAARRLFALSLAILTASAVTAQQANAPAPANTPATEKSVPAETTPSTEGAKQDEAIVLSPFTVDASKDIGYYAENTLAGSRISTNVGDLAASITVVTKQQLIDTASVDINDVFMYEANTEGANTYTQTDISRNGVPRDTIAGYSSDAGVPAGRANANRVRGLGSPDSAINNYPAISRVPFDAYNTNSLEISRGPNSLLFGTGSPAGIVNQSTAQAVLNKQASTVEARASSWDGKRVSFSHNQPLIDDKLAVYVSMLYDAKGFRRKPSDDITRRQYAAITYKPFKKTTLTGSFEHYDEFNNSPNSQTPRDYVSPWLQAGRPAYDPTTRMVTILDTGVVKGPYVLDTRSPGWVTGMPIGNAALNTSASAPNLAGQTTPASTLYIPGIAFGIGTSVRTLESTDRGQILGVIQPQAAWSTVRVPAPAYSLDYVRPALPFTGPNANAQWMFNDRRLTSSAGPITPFAPTLGTYGSYVQPSTTNRSIYDYEHINLLQENYGTQDMKTWNLEFQQEILPNLNFSAGWFRQDLNSVENYTVSNGNAITTLYVDTNVKNMDGTPNKYFGSPYLLDISPDTFKNPETNDNYRALLAYELDLTKHSNLLRFLGRHRLVGLWSRQDDQLLTLRYRNTFDGGDLRYQANPAAGGAIVANSGISRIFYLGQNDHGHVDYAPGRLGQPGYGGPSTATANTYNWTTGQWEQSQLHTSQQLFYAGAYGLNQKVIDGKSIALSSYFWNDRIVATVGLREDDYKARATNTVGLTTANTGAATDLYVNGIAIDPSWTKTRLKDWYRLNGRTKTTGVVFHALRWGGNEVSFHFNKSDNFNPPNGIPVDFYGTPLPKSTGEGKDYGVSVALFDNKLVARVNWFDSTNDNAPATAATTAIGRVAGGDTSNFRSWAEYVVRMRTNLSGEATLGAVDPTTGLQKLVDPQFGNNSFSGHALTQPMKDEIAKLMGVANLDTFPPVGVGGTQTNKAKGIEFQMIYNPLHNWNIKATAAKVEATYDNVAPEIDAWLNDGTPGSRLAFWKAATAPGIADFETNGGTPVHLSNFWAGYGYNSNVRLSNATSSTPSWTTSQGYYESAILPEINVAKALQGKTVPNERKWSFNVISNYAFQKGHLKGFAVGGGARWADKAIASFYGNTAMSARDSLGNVVAYDLTRPIYTASQINYDFWASYSRRVFKDKVMMKVQLNVRDAFENGHLEAVGFNFDGSPFAYRIVDPRQFYLTTTFSF